MFGMEPHRSSAVVKVAVTPLPTPLPKIQLQASVYHQYVLVTIIATAIIPNRSSTTAPTVP